MFANAADLLEYCNPWIRRDREPVRRTVRYAEPNGARQWLNDATTTAAAVASLRLWVPCVNNAMLTLIELHKL